MLDLRLSVVMAVVLSACASPYEPGLPGPAPVDGGGVGDASSSFADAASGHGDAATDVDAAPMATGSVEISDDWQTLFVLEKPTGKFDEPSFGGFNYSISSVATGFDASDMVVNLGDETTEDAAIAADLGQVGDLSGVAFDFSIRHVVGKNYSFKLSNTVTSVVTTLCWGVECPDGSIVEETLAGEPPFTGYNGLMVQLRAQEVSGASAKIANLELIGMTPTSGSVPLLDATVTPNTPSGIPFDPPGRIGQWILGTDLAVMSWELKGTITLTRPDAATSERSKVRLAVDFVKHTGL